MTSPFDRRVPMNDLKLQYERLKSDIDAALAEVVADTSFILGSSVEAFERDWAEYTSIRHAVGVSTGTDALKLALRAHDVGPGDEVITTSFTFAATVEAIIELGASPIFVDIEPRHFTMDVSQVSDCMSERTRAVIPVHIYGHPVDMDPLLELAGQRGVAVVEDAAQAHGARYRDQIVGSIGQVGCFSFYPGKNLGAYGDAGGIVTDDDVLAERLRKLRNHGQNPELKFWYDERGYNHRMDGFQGAVLAVKLRNLDAENNKRREIAARYCAALSSVEQLKLPGEASYAHHVYHLFVVRVPFRDELASALREAGVATAVQYPHALHNTPAYKGLGYAEGSLPVCERACSDILSLPMFPDLRDAQVDYVAECIRCHYGV